MTEQPLSVRRAAARRLPGAATVIVSLFAGLAGLAASYAVAGFTPSFVAGPIASLLSREMPAAVVRFAILVLGDLGETLNLVAALALAWFLLTLAASVGLAAGRRARSRVVAPVVGAASTGLLSVVLTGALLPAFATGAAVSVVIAATTLSADGRTPDVAADRRRILGGVASAVTVTLAGFLLGSGRDSDTTVAPLEVDRSLESETESLLGTAETQSLDVAGLEPLVSDSFYEVDINSVNPDRSADSWELSVTGAVEEERTYTYDDVTSMDAENQFVSLRCVGEGLNGRKLDNALWQGVPIMDLVEPAVPTEGCCVMLRAADGFYEEFPLSALEDGFLAFGMNGEALPRGHGYPARALIPGHWGEINVKWLTEIEILETEEDGYWEERGWHGTGPVNTVAKLHVENDLEDGRKQVAGHAYAGTRGIERVEVSTDGGDSWADARLSGPLPGEDVWRQWAYEYDPPERSHEVVVRATDGTGTLQPREEESPYPSGASGWVSKSVDP
ncbi:sulfite oxidase [Halobacterium sp. DL1]|nr:sulfite oxidase [Halobacterium sp. DL1]